MRHKELKAWTGGVAHLLPLAPGRPRLLGLSQWLQQVCAVDNFVLFVYEGNHRPLDLFDTFPADVRHVYVEDYQVGPYLLDPFYLACTRNQAPGLWRLRQFAPDHFYLGEYYQTYYQQTGLTEEIAFFVDLADGATAVLSLMRKTSSPAYSRDEMQLLECARPVVEQVVREAWELRRAQPRPAQDLDYQIREAFDQFGAQVLTAREQEIVQLLLRGHSSASVAEQLDISPGTVKIHRKNIYAKLGIGSQSELLGLFIRELAGRDAAGGMLAVG
ncbi:MULTISPECIES: LuxR C-terminal-related transcriptional regulator [unclassified Pseudomonas]|uniref:helix-turn-helix transcriptional regulator n=1 Tax=unclassified Pseudomonas TaxID=196821 RepID=UPI0023D80238|nr:LuxR C-terminal-related transcriptional regulator [Pseudomonas sp. PSE14]WEJ73029.1 LuxR C-terminal-related transcriptional regulator [Pseudomonas sp. PSE14]